ncbi:putative transcriptional elongation factor protein [Neofusicoccum parvum UCRNP2]|uniref:Putative transcriptional elongation factor protein n=1 Tax=Botryosphaeria parva (strain UCR-NP2) TaxID=1287680 RepID=R1FWY3_BOTPV|nr:putative transcriptional elongation factor protein [Neofusicoccum parvum UCRNP2]
MEDPEITNSPPDPSTLPEAGNDPGEPVRPDIDEENSTPNPPAAAPGQDMELTEAGQGTGDADAEDKGDNDDGLSDAESVLSDVDEAQFEDFDPNAIAIEDRPAIQVDESNVGLIGVHKRKRADGDGDGSGKKKKREGRRDKPKKSRKRRGEDGDEVSGAEGITTERRARRSTKKAEPLEEDWDSLTPDERRRKALDAKMDEALKGGRKKSRKQQGIDLEAQADAEIEDMRRRMTEAAQADNEGRERGEPAIHKLKLLPEVVALLNRNNLQNNLVDPDINLLQAVRFFLEPLNDGSMPAYNIQRELFTVLAKLPITKDSLVASGIGKVINFYTKTNRAESSIKRQAEKLIGEWTRPILKRTDDYRKKEVAEANYDPLRLPDRTTSKAAASQQAAAERRAKALAPPSFMNRARQEGQLRTYTVAPKSNVVANAAPVRHVGQSEAARRLKLGRAGGKRG